MSQRDLAPPGRFTRRLPPLWWIKRRMRLSRDGSLWRAEYRSRSTTWSTTAGTRDTAGGELLEWMRDVKGEAPS